MDPNIDEHVQPTPVRPTFSLSSSLQLFSIGMVLGVLTQLWNGPMFASAREFGHAAAVTQPVQSLSNDIVQLPFGAEAVRRCQLLCKDRPTKNAAACESGCSRLDSSTFGRRITLGELSAEVDAERILTSCLTAKHQLGTHNETSEWSRAVDNARNALREAQELPLFSSPKQLDRLLSVTRTASTQLGLPKAATVDQQTQVEDLRKVLCLRTQLIAIDQALRASDEQGDTFSARHYYTMHERLSAKIQAMEMVELSWLHTQPGTA